MSEICVCGKAAAEVPVKVHWADGDRTYWFCIGCAEDSVTWLGGTEIDMEAEARRA